MLKAFQHSQEENLIADLKSDNEEALTSIYYHYRESLFQNANRVLNDPECSEEIVQDVFSELWDKRLRLDIKVSLNAYLYAMTRYMVFRHIRNEKSRIRLHQDLANRYPFEHYLYRTPESFLIEKEMNERVTALMNELPPRCREIYRLSRHDQLSHKEISTKLHISPKTVENQITKALKVFRRLTD